jgi:hypothetical protein
MDAGVDYVDCGLLVKTDILNPIVVPFPKPSVRIFTSLINP